MPVSVAPYIRPLQNYVYVRVTCARRVPRASATCSPSASEPLAFLSPTFIRLERHAQRTLQRRTLPTMASMSSPRPIPVGISNSPGRPSPLSRPHWPWSTYTHRSSSSSASFHSTSSSSIGGAQTWEARTSTAASSPSTVLLSAGPSGIANIRMSSVSSHNAMAEDTTTRQWSFHVSGTSFSPSLMWCGC